MTTLTRTETSSRSATRPASPAAVLAVLLTAQLMAILDVNIVNVAGATIRTDLHTSGAGLQLVIAGYMISYAVLLITGARLGGMLGYRRAFLAGLATFTAASAACGIAASTAELVTFRFVQGAGAALMIPQVFSLIQRLFQGAARASALGRYAAVVAGGVVAGQIVGGALVSADLWGTGWRPVFAINVPLGAALLAVGARVLPRDLPGAGRRLDLPGLTALAVAVLALVVPLVLGHQLGWPAWCWLSLAGAVVAFGAFVAVQRRVAHPLMPGRVFRAAGLLPALGALFFMMLSWGGYLFSIALHLQAGLGYSPLRAGLAFVPMAVCFGAASLNWRRLPASWQPRLIPAALLVTAVSLALIAWVLHRTGQPGVAFLAAQVPFGLGAGAAFAPLMARALAGVAPADAADASGLVTTMVQLAQVVGLAVFGSWFLALVGTHGSAGAAELTVLGGGTAIVVSLACALGLPRTR
jgi:MFS family permease